MPRKYPPSKRQQGVALIVALIMVVIMSLLGLAGVRMIFQEERMVSYSYDRTLTFQAAEAALREAENGIVQVKPEPLTGACSSFTSGIYAVQACPPPTAGAATPRWLDSTFTGWANATTVGTGVSAPGVPGRAGGAGGVPGVLPAGGVAPAVEVSVVLATGGGVGVPPGNVKPGLGVESTATPEA